MGGALPHARLRGRRAAGAGRAALPGRPTARASAGIRWAATARWCSRCAIRVAIAACRRFAPIVAPSQVPWGEKAFAAYLGDGSRRMGRMGCLRADRARRANACRCSSTRATPTSSSITQLQPDAAAGGLRGGGPSAARCACTPATTTAITSSPASSATTSRITPPRSRRNGIHLIVHRARCHRLPRATSPRHATRHRADASVRARVRMQLLAVTSRFVDGIASR